MHAEGSQLSSSLFGKSISDQNVTSISTSELKKVQKVFSAVANLPLDLAMPICDRLSELPRNMLYLDLCELIQEEFDLTFLESGVFALKISD